MDLRLLLGEAFHQLEEERKRSDTLLSRVKELETHILTYTQVISQLLNHLVKQVNNMISNYSLKPTRTLAR